MVEIRINKNSPPIWRHIGKLPAQIGETPEKDDTEGKIRILSNSILNPVTTTVA